MSLTGLIQMPRRSRGHPATKPLKSRVSVGVCVGIILRPFGKGVVACDRIG